MPWGKCDDRFWDHPKVMAMTTTLLLPCGGLYWRAISWSNDKLADGRISAATVRMLNGTKRQGEELVRVGLWEGDWRGGYRVHDYFDFNKSREQVLADRQKWADQKAGQRMSIADSTEESTADIREVSTVESPRVSSARIPSPVLPSSRPSEIPPPPAKRGKRNRGTSPRQVGDSPRQTGDNPRANGTSTRQIREDRKSGTLPDSVNAILRRAAAVGKPE